MPQLREFIYIDNESLNSNLSSLGKGIPSEITHSSEDETEKGGQGGGRIAGIGGEGRYFSVDREQIETTLDITAPYRFQDLLDEIEDHGIELHKNPDPRSLSRSDLVRIEGEVRPMSLLKIEMALDAFGDFIDPEFNDALQTLGESEAVSSQERTQFEALSKVLDQFSGSEYPLRIETGSDTYCTTLERTNMRKSVFDAFSEQEEYTLVGRVKHHIPVNDEWNPIHALNIIEQYVPEDDTGEEFSRDLRSGAEQMNISIGKEDLRVQGHTAVIEPIAMYW